MVSGLPWVMKECDWFFGTTALTSGTLSLMPCNQMPNGDWRIALISPKKWKWFSQKHLVKLHLNCAVFQFTASDTFILLEIEPQQRRTWGHWGARTCWEDTSPAEPSSSPLPPAAGALDGAPKYTHTHSQNQTQNRTYLLADVTFYLCGVCLHLE